VEIVKNCSKDELTPIIQGKILEGSTIYSDGWKADDGLILNGYESIIEYFILKMNLLEEKIMLTE
jgi:transposase-like protein